MKKDYRKKLFLTWILIAAMLPALSANSLQTQKCFGHFTEYFDIFTRRFCLCSTNAGRKADSLY